MPTDAKPKRSAPSPEPRVLRLTAASEPLELLAAESESPLRKFKIVAYTGGAMQVGYGLPVVVDLAGARAASQSQPILKDHDASRIVGHSESIEITARTIKVAGLLSGVGEAAQEVTALAANGFPWRASIGAAVHKLERVEAGQTVLVNGRNFAGPVYVARQTTLSEVSFVALAGDNNSSATIAARAPFPDQEPTMPFDQWVRARGFDPDQLSADQRTSLQAMFDAERTPATEPREKQPADPPPVKAAAGADATPPDAVAALRASAAAEVKRLTAVRKLCGERSELLAQAIEAGWDEQRTELEVLRASRPKGPAIHTGPDPQESGALEAALCLRAGMSEARVGKYYDERTMNAAVGRELRGFGLHALLYRTLQAAGESVHFGVMTDGVIRRALRADLALRASSGFSSTSFTGLLENVANKTLLESFEAVAAVGPTICSATDNKDFKPSSRYRLTLTGDYDEIAADGELHSAALTDEKFTNQVKTQGMLVALTREDITNDDLGAFLKIPRLLGRKAALAVEKAVFKLLLSNPSSFFASGKKNLATGAGSVLDIAGLTAAEQLFTDQTDLAGEPVLLTPRYLLVPSSLKVTAQELMKETRVNQYNTDGKPKTASNPHAGKWEAVATPFLNAQGLTGSSATAWYLLADPADVAFMEIAYLQGNRVPTIESADTDFNKLGIQWRSYFDFGVAMQEHRAAVKSAGA